MLDTQSVMNLLDDKRDDPKGLRTVAFQLVEEGWRNQVQNWFEMGHNRSLAQTIGWRIKEKSN